MIENLPLNKKYIFLDLAARLTQTQLLILKDLAENAKLHEINHRQYMEGLYKHLAEKYADGNAVYLKLLLSDLHSAHLIIISATDPLVTINNLAQHEMVPSEIGHEFINYLKM